MNTQDEPTNCHTCNASLERGYSYRYKNNILVSALCFNCASDRDLNEYRETNVLVTSFCTDNTLKLYDEPSVKKFIWGAGDVSSNLQSLENILPSLSGELQLRVGAHISFLKVYQKIKTFEQDVWFKGLQDLVRPSKDRGFSAKDGNLTVMTYSMAGRCMITIEDDKASVTMLCDESAKTSSMGDRGIRATESQAIGLLDRAVKGYQDGTLKFTVDKEVSYL